MSQIVTSSPAKIILFGEYAVNRNQPAIATAVDLRVLCRVTARKDRRYTLKFKEKEEKTDLTQLMSFKERVDTLRRENGYDEIRETAGHFFSTTSYVLAYMLERFPCPGLDIEWRSPLPIGSGMGSGAAASTSMIQAVLELTGQRLTCGEIADLSWKGDYIAHGGIASSLDSSTCAFGGLIYYTVAEGAKPLDYADAPRIIIGDSKVATETASLNTRVRVWLEQHPARMHIFRDMGYLVQRSIDSFRTGDLATLGQLMNIHELLQEKIGTSCPALDGLIETSIGAGAFGAKISGGGGGGIMIALVTEKTEDAVARAIGAAGGSSMVVNTCAEGTRVEPGALWEKNLV
jgi:mevalonate kinase